MQEKKVISVENTTEQKIFTNQMMYSYLRNIEELAESHPKTQIHNLHPQGAHIKNVASLGSITDIMKLLQPI